MQASVTHRIALSHASGVAAEAILEKLSESGIAPDSLVLLDHESNVGKRLPYGGSHLRLADQLQYDLSTCALLLMPQADAELEAAALQQGCLLVSHVDSRIRARLFFLAAAGRSLIVLYRNQFATRRPRARMPVAGAD